MFEYFIAKRYLRSKHKLNFITIISILSTIGITIGVAALVIVLSVFNGFGGLVKSILINVDPHVKVSIISTEGAKQLEKLEGFLKFEDGIKYYHPVIEGKVIISAKKSYQILNLKGIDSTLVKNGWGLKNKIVIGKLNLFNITNYPEVTIALSKALKLSTHIGDTITIT